MVRLLLVVVVSSLVAQGQVTPRKRTIVPVTAGPYVAGVPVSATETLDFVPAPDASAGTVAVHVEDRFYRDALGRTRENIQTDGGQAWCYLVDPVARTQSFWREGTTAVRMAKTGPRALAGELYEPKYVAEPERQMEGFAVRRTIPVRLPGARAQDQVVEVWYSHELHLEVLRVVDEPGVGRSTYALHKIALGEPDGSLFVSPGKPKSIDLATAKDLPPGVMVTSPPVVLFAPEAEFSAEARKNKVQGNVLVFLKVDETGKPVSVRVLRGIGSGLDQKAIEAVRQYRFKPAMEDGIPIEVEMIVEVNFQQ